MPAGVGLCHKQQLAMAVSRGLSMSLSAASVGSRGKQGGGRIGHGVGGTGTDW